MDEYWAIVLMRMRLSCCDCNHLETWAELKNTLWQKPYISLTTALMLKMRTVVLNGESVGNAFN